MKKLFICILMILSCFIINVKAEELNGLVTEDGNTYYYKDGVKQKGLQTIDGKTYFFSRIGSNQMKTGTFKIDASYYHFNTDGAMVTGWHEEKGNKYYFDQKGKRVKGLQTIDGKTYFFSRIGSNQMRTGLFKIDNYYYYFDEITGEIQTGYKEMKDGLRYFDATGKMKIGVAIINNKTYFFNSIGIKSWGFQSYNNKTYYFSLDDDHEIVKGFIKIDKYYYYFDETTGVMQKGFKTVEGKKRFFSRVNGQMRTGRVTIDGNIYFFDNVTGEFIKLQYVPKYFSQKDSRWANRIYGLGNMRSTGCAPTSMAMAFSSIKSRTIYPTDVANYLYYNTNQFNKRLKGTSGLGIIKASAYYGVKLTGIASLNDLNRELSKGKIVYAAMGNGKFATVFWNHAIILYDYSGGKTYAYDPLDKSKNGWISTSTIWSQKSTDPDDKTGGYYLYSLG